MTPVHRFSAEASLPYPLDLGRISDFQEGQTVANKVRLHIDVDDALSPIHHSEV